MKSICCIALACGATALDIKQDTALLDALLLQAQDEKVDALTKLQPTANTRVPKYSGIHMGLDHSIANMFRYCDSLDGKFSKIITVDDIKTMIANARTDLVAKIGSTATETRIPVGLEDYVEQQRYKRITNENRTERLVDLACMGYNGSLGLTGTGIPCSGMIYDIQMFVAREGFGPNGVGTRSAGFKDGGGAGGAV